MINTNYISPIGSNLSPLGNFRPGGLGYTNTLGEYLGFSIGSAYRDQLCSSFAQMYPELNNSDSTSSISTSSTESLYTSTSPNFTAKGDASGLASPDEGDGQPGIASLIDKYKKYLYG